ncbi:MAG TPA: SpoIID/LytB domain-containing protein [Acidimicrobiales bacterium]
MGRSVRAFVAVALALGGVLVGVFGAPLNASAAPRRRPPPRPPAPVPTWTVDRVRVESVGAAASVVGVGTYPGVLDVVPAAAGAPRGLAVVNEVGFEEYVAGISEVPSEWPIEALKAQAVAARTYALTTTKSGAGFEHYPDTRSQVYGGVDAEHPASDEAIAATRRQVLRYDGEPAFTQFGSSSGGWTSAGSVPYLPAQADPYDGWSGNPNHDWSEKVTDARFESAWPGLGNLKRIVVPSRDGNGDWGGRVTTLRLVGSKATITVSGDTMRSVLGLRSTWVTFRVR